VKIRPPLAVFAALVAATVAAFFIVQHLKVTNPIVAGDPNPKLPAFNPVDGGNCGGISHKRDWISFYLDSRSDDVNVYVINSSGDIVDQVASGVHMRAKPPQRRKFFWNGREADGSVAPDGSYRFRVALVHQGRTAVIGGPMVIETVPPRPVVTSVTPSLIPAAGGVTVHYKGNERRGGYVLVYRTDLPGKPRLVKSFKVPFHGSEAVWDGTIDQRPAPAGTYLLGFKATDAACNVGTYPLGSFPLSQDPPAGTTAHAGVTVRYLAAEPPIAPVPAGKRALVLIDSRQRPYRWTLTEPGVRKPVSHGADRSVELRIRLPSEGLYVLSIRSSGHRTAVPLIASAPASSRPARMLVVMPALTWQGLNPVDDDGDGLPDTLTAHVPVRLARVYANGLPAGFGDEAALVAYLRRTHLRYDLTTDVALAAGASPGLAGHHGVVFAGAEEWLPAGFAPTLQAFVRHGGHVLSIGIDSLRRLSTVSQTSAGPEALRPTAPSPSDLFGAHLGPVVSPGRSLLTLVNPPDRLGIFTLTSGAFTGFRTYQPVTSLAPPAKLLSSAGVSPASPSIAGFSYGRGSVVEIGLVGFGASLARDVDSQELISRLWTVLAR
jgi:hypothetical protein